MTGLAQLVYLTEADMRQSMTMPEAIARAEQGIEADAAGAVAGDKFYMPVDDRGFIKPFAGYLAGEDLAYVKTFSFFEQNPARGFPTTDSIVLLFAADTGRPVAVMEANWVTGLKTGASTAVTARRLARPDSRIATIFGAGGLGRHHAEALDHVFALDEIRIVDPVAEVAESFAREAPGRLRAPIRVVCSPEEAVRGADIVVTVTTGSAVNVEPDWVHPGAFIASLGSYQEVAIELFERVDRLVVDRWHYVSYRIPEMVTLIPQAAWNRPTPSSGRTSSAAAPRDAARRRRPFSSWRWESGVSTRRFSRRFIDGPGRAVWARRSPATDIAALSGWARPGWGRRSS